MITLKNVLAVNAISSGATGLLLTLMPGTIAAIFEVPQNWPFLATGLFLVFFSMLAGYTAAKKEPDRILVNIIIMLDWLWVMASVIILLQKQLYISQWGYLLTGGVAAWVALMAFLQYAGLRKTHAIERN